jgi:hypothetical protein
MKEITVRVSAAMVTQVLTEGYLVPLVKCMKGLPAGARLIGASFDQAEQAVLTFRAPGFPDGAQETLSIEMKLMRGFRNAHLAAPDLYDALKFFGRAYPDGQLCFCAMPPDNPLVAVHSTRCAVARAAIAKAETR